MAVRLPATDYAENVTPTTTRDTFLSRWLELASCRSEIGNTLKVISYGYLLNGRIATRASKRPSMTWAESVDAALCFGWIHGVRKRVDDHLAHCHRETPRDT